MSTATATPPKSDKAAEPTTKGRLTFQVLSGTYRHGAKFDPKTGNLIERDRAYGPGRPDGDIVHSDLELDVKFNRPGSTVFKRLGEDGNPIVAELESERKRRTDTEQMLRDSFASMSLRELMDYAEKKGWEVKDQSKKEDALKEVLAHAGL